MIRFMLVLLTLTFAPVLAPVASAPNAARRVVIRPVGNQMNFAVTTFSVRAGEQIRLVFENTATVEAMKHNVVILDDAAAIDRVGIAAISAADNGYIPDDEAILFYTPLAGPQETVEVTFTAPSEPGAYPYICTFPGHYVLMRGVMTVTS
jgi:azurin